MLSNCIRSFVVGVVFLSIPFQLFALDVGWEGYFRTRANYHYNLDLDRSKNPEIRAFADMRFRLNPTMYVTDKIRIRSSFNFFDGVLGKDPLRTRSYQNPAQTNDRALDPTETEATVGRSVAGYNTSALGGAYSPDGLLDSQDLTPLQLRRVWGEFDIPYGTIKAGRMPNHWGMGIFANAGDDAWQEVGSTRDRIMFDTSFGSYYVRPGVGWMVEGALDQSNDDFYEYFLMFGRKTENQDIGLFLSFNAQDEYNLPAGSGLNGAKSNFWAFDFYLSHQFERVRVQAEGALFSGKVVGKDLLAMNGALRADWRWTKLSLLTEAGYASGTAGSDAANNDLKSVAFSRDYDISMLVFEEAIPGGATTYNSAGAADGVATAPHSGAITNAIYARLKLGYDLADFFHPYLNVVVPMAAKKSFDMAGSFYGVEYNLITLWPLNKYLTAEVSFAHFIPGSVYDRVSQSHTTILARGGLIAQF